LERALRSRSSRRPAPPNSAGNSFISRKNKRKSSGRTKLKASDSGKPLPKQQILMIVKGKENIQVRLVQKHISSLNRNDSFLLDVGNVIYCWSGKNASRRERNEACIIADRINDDERRGRAKVVILEEGGQIPDDFWRVLGVTDDEREGKSITDFIKEDAEHDDEAQEEIWKGKAEEDTLYKIDGSNLVEISGKMTSDKLLTTCSFILDCGEEVYFWYGKLCFEWKACYRVAVDHFTSVQTRPSWAAFRKISEGNEPVLFKRKFEVWEDKKNEKERKYTRVS